MLWRDALAGRSAFAEQVSLGLEGLWRGALADILARCSAFKDVLAGRSAFVEISNGNPGLFVAPSYPIAYNIYVL